MKTCNLSLLGAALLIAVLGYSFRNQADDGLQLNIARTNSNVTLTWTNTGAALESSLLLTGVWNEITGAVSPRVITPSNMASYFRLRGTNTPASFDHRYIAPTFTTSVGDPFGCGCTSPENPNSLAAGGGAQDNGQGSVLLHTGELTQYAVALEIPGRGINWRFELRYRSGMSYDGPMGQGWDFNGNRRLAVETNGNVLCINGLGRVDRYTRNLDGTFNSPAGFYTLLRTNTDGTIYERDRHGTTNFYFAPDSLGIAKLSRISDRNANQMTFQHNSGGQLTNVIDTLARSIAYRYDSNGRLTNVTDFAGRAMRFDYNTNGDLAAITSPAVTGTPGNNFPSGKTTRYTYSSGFADPRFNHQLLTVTAPNEVAVSGPPGLTAQYDTNPLSTNAARLLSLTLGGTNATGVAAGGTISYTYASFGPVSSNDYATAVFQNTVTNRNGDVTEYRFNQLGNIVRSIQFTRGIRAGDPAAYTNSFVYNQDGEMIGHTDAELATVEYTFNSGNSNRLARGNLLQTRRLPGPRGGDQSELVLARTYETNFNFVTTATDARSNTMNFSYDARGNRTQITHAISNIVEDFEYNSAGQMTAHILPDNGSGSRRRDVMTYYSAGLQAGYLQSQRVDATNLNLTTTYEYNSAGNVIRTIDPLGNDTLYTVNSLNQIVLQSSRAVSTQVGSVRYIVNTFYDANDNVTRVDVQNRDETGAVVSTNVAFTTTNTYDILNRRLTTTQEVTATNNTVTAYAYDANGNAVLTRFGESVAGVQSNNVVQTFYDERNLLFRTIRAPGDPAQSTDQFDYDGNGNQIRIRQGIESSPRIKVMAYDGFNREVTETDPMGNVTSFHYDANGNAISNQVAGELIDLTGSTLNVRLSEASFTYDAMNRLIQTDSAYFNTTSGNPIGSGRATNQTIYSGTSQVLQTIDANGHGTTTSYDTANRPSLVTDARTNSLAYTYNANGLILTTTEVDKSDLGSSNRTFVKQYTYDTLDRRIRTVDNAGITNLLTYDSRNNPATTSDGRGNVTRFAYDGLYRLTTTTRYLTATGLGGGAPAGTIITRQSWDHSSRLTGQTDANSNTTAYVYDPLNRMVQTTFADGTSHTFAFDVHHNTVTDTDANGNVVNATYDLLNRILNKTITRGPGIAGPTFEAYQYDGLSRIVRSENDDSVVTRSYSSFSDILTEIQHATGGSAQTVTRTYDTEGNVLSLGYPGGRTVYTTYDELDRKLTVSDLSTASATYSYFGPTRVERRDYGNGTRAAFVYDGIRRLTNGLQSVISGGAPIDSRAYAWDAAHNKTAANDLLVPALDSRSFSYDSVSRLVQSATTVVGPTNIYSLDGVGNRLNVTGGTNAGAYSLSAATPPADHQMNQYTATPFDARAYDANGNLTNAATTVSVYDYRDLLVSVARYDGVSAYTNVLSAKYDCFGRRIEKAASGVVTRYYYAGWQEIEEQHSGHSTIATYVWGNGIDELLNMNRSGQTYYFHEDDLGSIGKVTDNAGNVAEQYRYDDYGQPRFFDAIGNDLAGSQLGNNTLFTGRRYDPETGLYYYRTRYLDSAAGRFTTRDSIGIWGDMANVGNGFAYVGNGPQTVTDPFGLRKVCNEAGICFEFEELPSWPTYLEKIEVEDPPLRLRSNGLARATSPAPRGAKFCLLNPSDPSCMDLPQPKSTAQYAHTGFNTSRSNLKDKASIGSSGQDGVDFTHANIGSSGQDGIFAAGNNSPRNPYASASAASFNTSRSNLKDKASLALSRTPYAPVPPPTATPQEAASFNTSRSNLKDKASLTSN